MKCIRCNRTFGVWLGPALALLAQVVVPPCAGGEPPAPCSAPVVIGKVFHPVSPTVLLNTSVPIKDNGDLLAASTLLLDEGRVSTNASIVTGLGYILFSSTTDWGTAAMVTFQTPTNVYLAAIGLQAMVGIWTNGLPLPQASVAGRIVQATLGTTNDFYSTHQRPASYGDSGLLTIGDPAADERLQTTELGLGGSGTHRWLMTVYFDRPVFLPRSALVAASFGSARNDLFVSNNVMGVYETHGLSTNAQADQIIYANGLANPTTSPSLDAKDNGKLGMDLLVVPLLPESGHLTMALTSDRKNLTLDAAPIQYTTFDLLASPNLKGWASTHFSFSPQVTNLLMAVPSSPPSQVWRLAPQ